VLVAIPHPTDAIQLSAVVFDGLDGAGCRRLVTGEVDGATVSVECVGDYRAAIPKGVSTMARANKKCFSVLDT